jgi:ribosomal protein L37AE/L43A
VTLLLVHFAGAFAGAVAGVLGSYALRAWLVRRSIEAVGRKLAQSSENKLCCSLAYKPERLVGETWQCGECGQWWKMAAPNTGVRTAAP